MLNRIVKFIRLPNREKLIFFQAVNLLITWRIRLCFQNFKTVINHNNVKSAQAFARRKNPLPPQRLSALLNAAGKVIPYSTCLTKALAGQILFSLHGYKTRLHIGVEKDSADKIKAHAWLTLDGNLTVGNLEDIDNYKELFHLGC